MFSQLMRKLKKRNEKAEVPVRLKHTLKASYICISLLFFRIIYLAPIFAVKSVEISNFSL